jgi:hypothetical protein
MWIAKWDDSAARKGEIHLGVRHLSDEAGEGEEEFDKAVELERNFSKIEEHILTSLDSNDTKTRKIATVVLPDNAASMRVG